MVVVPTLNVVASPWLPGVLLMVALLVVDDVQLTCVVRVCVVLSEKVPVASNCCVVPRGFVGFVGVTAIEDNVAVVTVSVVDALTVPSVAVIVVAPTPTAVASPPAAIVAFDRSLEDQVTSAVAGPVLLSE
jgi:hypothetical protein